MTSYPEYRTVADRWFPPAPIHWIDRPVWTLFTRVARKGYPSETLLSVYRDHGVIPKASRDDNFNRESEDLTNYQLVEPGDLVVNKMKAWQGSLSISEHRGIVSPAYFVYRPHHDEDSRFLHHLLRSRPLIGAYIGSSKGVRVNQWDLDPQAFSRLKIALPPVNEQRAIADYLDRETAKIDTLIEAQQRFVELLRKRRRAVVRSSLEPQEHWLATRVKWVGSASLGKMLDSGRALREGDALHPYVRAADVLAGGTVNFDGLNEMPFSDTEMQHFDLRTGDVLLIEGGATVGRPGYVFEDVPGVAFQKTVNRLRLGESFHSRFAYWALQQRYEADYYANHFSAVSFVHLTGEKLREVELPYPPLDEQRQIAAYLDEQTSKIDRLIAESERLIELSRKRRSALITAAVTGQIDVRDEVA